jgi:hypothetical protein
MARMLTGNRCRLCPHSCPHPTPHPALPPSPHLPRHVPSLTVLVPATEPSPLSARETRRHRGRRHPSPSGTAPPEARTSGNQSRRPPLPAALVHPIRTSPPDAPCGREAPPQHWPAAPTGSSTRPLDLISPPGSLPALLNAPFFQDLLRAAQAGEGEGEGETPTFAEALQDARRGGGASTGQGAGTGSGLDLEDLQAVRASILQASLAEEEAAPPLLATPGANPNPHPTPPLGRRRPFLPPLAAPSRSQGPFRIRQLLTTLIHGTATAMVTLPPLPPLSPLSPLPLRYCWYGSDMGGRQVSLTGPNGTGRLPLPFPRALFPFLLACSWQ